MNEIYEKYSALRKEYEAAQAEVAKLTDGIESARAENEALRHRLQHLLESDYIRSFDEYDPRSHTYALDIRDADNMRRSYDELGRMAARYRGELEMLKECVVRMTMERLGVS